MVVTAHTSAVSTADNKERSNSVPLIEFPNTDGFKEQQVEQPFTMTAEGWRCGLRQTEVDDNKQKLRARPYLAWGVGLLLLLQNIGIWYIVLQALDKGELSQLQLIFSTLIAGTLTESYLLMKLITEKVFGDINYHNGDSKEG